MTLIEDPPIELATPSGPMRTHILRPANVRGRYTGIVLYSEIFQITAPIRRTAAFLAGHGYVVACPEIYHEFEAPGTVLAYDQAGSDRGNELKYRKSIQAYDADATAIIDHLSTRPDTTGAVGAMGICMGGHLALRAAFDPRVLATACFYATDVHKASLGSTGDDTLPRVADISGELLMVWGRQDLHVPTDGRMKILARLNQTDILLNWHEVNGAHAFLRDEGPRFDPEHSRNMLGLALDLFHRCLH